MAVRIRLKRLGAKKRPTYRFVATDSRMPRDGRFIETLGYYSPIEKPARVTIFEERMIHWLEQGALPSDTVATLMKQVGFWKKYEMKQKGEDISEVTLSETITERTKKRKSKKKAKTE
nr:30S ribosomal protein S16 [candidate division Zixibacteria bacterium]